MKRSLVLFVTYVTAAFTVLALDISQVHAIGTIGDGADSARATDQPVNLFGDAGVFSKISSVLLFIVGAIAVIMIVIGGLRYVISGGDATQVQAAKNTILYALVGVIIAILAYAAVNFVIASFAPNASNTNGTNSYGASTQ
ncbi:hypothetical protein EOL96_02850 [Candidatus Saccharibacteria bacterium]|nr:hypothetical protein [Candidatus Saccharibacteria bacterium]